MEGVGDPRISPEGRRIVYARQWMDPMTDGRKSALWIMNADGSRNRYLVEGSSPRWSPSGDRIAFLACGTPGGDRSALEECDEGSERQIWVRIMEGEGEGSVTQVTRLTEGASDIAWSPDGRSIAYAGADSTGRTYLVDELHLMNADGSDPRPIQAGQDRSPDDVVWAADGSGVYYTVEDHGTRDAWFASTRGQIRRITDGRHVLYLSDVNAEGTAVAVVSTPHRPEDVVSFPVRGDAAGSLTWLTEVNADVLDGVALGEVEEIRYRSAGGLEIQGWIVKPPGFDPSERSPLILRIHGGPWSMYDVGFSYSFQNHAANGYVVLYTNPRGSTGYGTEFVDEIDHAYPGQDYDDLMAGVDEVLSRGYVDEENMLVTGCSGGGVLSSWVIGQTDRFAAAVVRCPVVDWFSFVGTTDGAYWYHNFREYPWVDPTEHLERSPLMHVGSVSTPTLLMTGVKDLRTPMSQTIEYYQALKIRKVPAKLIQVADEWHGTGSNPSNFMRTQLYVRKWFREHMTEEMRERTEERRTDGG